MIKNYPIHVPQFDIQLLNPLFRTAFSSGIEILKCDKISALARPAFRKWELVGVLRGISKKGIESPFVPCKLHTPITSANNTTAHAGCERKNV